MSTNDLEVPKNQAEAADSRADDKVLTSASSEKDVSFRSDEIKELDY